MDCILFSPDGHLSLQSTTRKLKEPPLLQPQLLTLSHKNQKP